MGDHLAHPRASAHAPAANAANGATTWPIRVRAPSASGPGEHKPLSDASRLPQIVDAPGLSESRETWEAIAPAFSRTRQRAWVPVLAWADRNVRRGARVLDLACGNGRHGGPLSARGLDVTGADFSRPLLAFARERGVAVVAAEVGALPFRAGAFDAALFIAALHNVPGRARRIAALAELARALAPGAPALVTVWARWQPGRVGYFLRELPHHWAGDADHEFGDAMVPWAESDKAPARARFYHFYSRFELREDLRAAGFAVRRIGAARLAGKGALADNLIADVRKE